MDSTDSAPRPVRLAHVVLRTARFEESVQWWRDLLVADTRFENDFIAFLTYDEEHHRLAIVRSPQVDDDGRRSAGMEHVAFTYADLDDLLATYVRLAENGTMPVAPINHGMTLSLYYADPDGNQVELQIDTMSTTEAESFMAGAVFAANPIGVRFDPVDLVARRADGASVEELVAYVPA